jgi:hypothetical protein
VAAFVQTLLEVEGMRVTPRLNNLRLSSVLHKLGLIIQVLLDRLISDSILVFFVDFQSLLPHHFVHLQVL